MISQQKLKKKLKGQQQKILLPGNWQNMVLVHLEKSFRLLLNQELFLLIFELGFWLALQKPMYIRFYRYKYYRQMLPVRRDWCEQEDQIIKNSLLISQNQRWNQIVEQLNSKGFCRTAKQCRERWHNQLKPSIQHQKPLTSEEVEIILDLQKKLGNQWAQIARQLPGRSDNNVKNFFYSTLRKGIRRIKLYLEYNHQKKLANQINPSLLRKIIVAADKKKWRQLVGSQIKIDLHSLAKQITDTLVEISKEAEAQVLEVNIHLKKTLMDKIKEFNLQSKRVKKKNLKDPLPKSQFSFLKQTVEILNSKMQGQRSDRLKTQNEKEQTNTQQLTSIFDLPQSSSKKDATQGIYTPLVQNQFLENIFIDDDFDRQLNGVDVPDQILAFNDDLIPLRRVSSFFYQI